MLNLLNRNIFINYFPDENIYILHSILRDFLRNRFYTINDVGYQRCILKRAGEAYLAHSDYFHAIRLFNEIEDYDAFLLLPLRDDYFNYDFEQYHMYAIVQLIRKCPEKKLKYPMSLITLAFQFVLQGYFEEFEYLCELIKSAFHSPENITLSSG